MVDETVNLDPAGAAALEAHFLDPDAPNPARGCPAGDLAPGRFRVKARTWRERHHPVSIEARHAGSVLERRVEFIPDRDGMAWLNTCLPADTAAGIWERTTAAARALQSPAEGRTLAQLRADVAATLLLSGHPATTSGTSGTSASGSDTGISDTGISGTGASTDSGFPDTGITGSCATAEGVPGPGWGGEVPSPRAQVLIMVPVLSLLGFTEEPATLDGYGPIPPSMARRLVAEGADSFHRVLTDPRNGAPLEIGRKSYRLTKAQRQWLRLRDGKCPFPGCNNLSLDNEADHLLAWADGGTTGISNLGQPCRKHHGLKHATGWAPTGAGKEHPPGWTSPTGRTYPSEHQDWEPPHLPDDFLAPDPDPPRALEPGYESDLRPIPEPDFDSGLAPDPGLDSDLQLPEDPDPDWYLSFAA